MILGGGIEGTENPKECCMREVAEKTGLIVVPKQFFLIVNEGRRGIYLGEYKALAEFLK